MKKQKIKDKIPYILLFLFFTLILFLCPISGDDWGNYIVGIKGIKSIIKNTITLYTTWEGRIISRLLINIFTCNKFIWNIVNSIAIISIIYILIKLIIPKNKKTVFLLLILLFLGMNPYMFSQTITWIAGNITYLFVIPLFLFYIKYILEGKYKNSKKIETLIIASLNLLMTLFIEHIAALLVLFNISIIIYEYLKNKKIDKTLLLYLSASIIGLLIIIASPGSKYRNTIENIEFNNLSILGKIKYNYLNFINYSFVYNPFLLLLMSIASFLQLKNKIKNKKIKLLLYPYLSFIPIIIAINYLLSFLKLYNFNINNKLLMIYFTSYIIISTIFILFKYKEKRKDIVITFYAIGILANTIMLLSPTWGYRTTLATYLFLSISMIIIIDTYLKETKTIKILLSSTLTIFLTFYLTLYTNVFIAQRALEKSIETQLKTNNKIITINTFPNFANCNINPETEYHQEKFKQYYSIPQNTKLNLIEKNWKYKIFYLEK